MSALIDKLQDLNASISRGNDAPRMVQWGAERFAHALTDLGDLFLYRFDDEDDEELSAAVVGADLG